MYQHQYLMEKLREFDREACRPCVHRIEPRRSGPLAMLLARARGIRYRISSAPGVRTEACHDCC